LIPCVSSIFLTSYDFQSPAPCQERRTRHWRRRIVIGGAVVITGAHRSRKLKQQDIQQIEEYTGAPVEELEEDELDEAIKELGIQEEPLSDSDQAALDAAG
jgi:hypothetical protein